MLNHRIYTHEPIVLSLKADVENAVRSEHSDAGIVDVSLLAEAIRKRHLEANIAREDIEQLVMQACGLLSAPMLLLGMVDDDLPAEERCEIYAQLS